MDQCEVVWRTSCRSMGIMGTLSHAPQRRSATLTGNTSKPHGLVMGNVFDFGGKYQSAEHAGIRLEVASFVSYSVAMQALEKEVGRHRDLTRNRTLILTLTPHVASSGA